MSKQNQEDPEASEYFRASEVKRSFENHKKAFVTLAQKVREKDAQVKARDQVLGEINKKYKESTSKQKEMKVVLFNVDHVFGNIQKVLDADQKEIDAEIEKIRKQMSLL